MDELGGRRRMVREVVQMGAVSADGGCDRLALLSVEKVVAVESNALAGAVGVACGRLVATRLGDRRGSAGSARRPAPRPRRQPAQEPPERVCVARRADGVAEGVGRL